MKRRQGQGVTQEEERRKKWRKGEETGRRGEGYKEKDDKTGDFQDISG